MFMDIGEEIRFRVTDETFVDLTPTGPEVHSKDQMNVDEQETKKSPYTITVSFNINTIYRTNGMVTLDIFRNVT